MSNRIDKTHRSDALKWIGIVGGAITVVGNAQTLLFLSEWAHRLISVWTIWFHRIWSLILPFKLNALDASLLTINFFFILNILNSLGHYSGERRKIPKKLWFVAFILLNAFLFSGSKGGADRPELLRPYLEWGNSLVEGTRNPFLLLLLAIGFLTLNSVVFFSPIAITLGICAILHRTKVAQLNWEKLTSRLSFILVGAVAFAVLAGIDVAIRYLLPP